MLGRRLALLTLALGAVGEIGAQTRTPVPQGSASTTAPPVSRDEWQRPADIFAALQIRAGSRIADLGAGQGWLTTRLAKAVGPTGRVFAVDIDEAQLGRLAEVLAKDTVRNVELVLAEDDDPRLPYGTLDGVVIVNAYHEMPKRVPILESVKRSLRPGGLLVIVDNTPADTITTRKEQTARHSLAIDFARDDLEAQGFEVVRTDPSFIQRATSDHVMRQWILIARRGVK